MFVPLTHDGEKSWPLKLVCPGNAMSVSHEKLLLQKIATVNMNLGFDDVCKEKIAYAAYNNEPWVFEVSNITGEMVRYPVEPYVKYWPVAWEWEIQAIFFKMLLVSPIPRQQGTHNSHMVSLGTSPSPL